MVPKYPFHSQAFNADPENCQFTEDENRSLFARELDDYEQEVPMTPAEKRALRRWVTSGHSVHDSPGSKYICDFGMDFLDVYRADHEISLAVRGMTPAQKQEYIKEYVGYEEPSQEDLKRQESNEKTPDYVKNRFGELRHQFYVLLDFLAREGLWEEALEYLEEHKDDDSPLPFTFIL